MFTLLTGGFLNFNLTEVILTSFSISYALIWIIWSTGLAKTTLKIGPKCTSLSALGLMTLPLIGLYFTDYCSYHLVAALAMFLIWGTGYYGSCYLRNKKFNKNLFKQKSFSGGFKQVRFLIFFGLLFGAQLYWMDFANNDQYEPVHTDLLFGTAGFAGFGLWLAGLFYNTKGNLKFLKYAKKFLEIEKKGYSSRPVVVQFSNYFGDALCLWGIFLVATEIGLLASIIMMASAFIFLALKWGSKSDGQFLFKAANS